jgi:transposase InsO family protein
MISTQDRRDAITLIDEATDSGARLFRACDELGLCKRTYQRWTAQEGVVKADGRPDGERLIPANALSEAERQKLVALSCAPEFASLPPSQIVPILADRGEYYASESTFYRVLKAHDLQHHRGRSAAPSTSEPKRHLATGPNEVWVWDITWLPGPVLGTFYYLYLMLDLFSRKVVGWEVYEEETAEYASLVIRKASLAEGRGLTPMVLHSDNGSPMKGATMLATLQKLGIAPSFSRPGVSDDNAQAEAFFRTLKYRPGYPSKGFQTLDAVRDWVMKFVRWYNTRHQHSALKFVTPAQRHQGADIAVLQARKALYEEAKAANPERWCGPTRNWDRPATVWLNPVRQENTKLKLAA